MKQRETGPKKSKESETGERIIELRKRKNALTDAMREWSEGKAWSQYQKNAVSKDDPAVQDVLDWIQNKLDIIHTNRMHNIGPETPKQKDKTGLFIAMRHELDDILLRNRSVSEVLQGINEELARLTSMPSNDSSNDKV